MAAARSIALTAGKVLLVGATLVCLASIGGAMLVAFPVLVPLHWLAARDRGPHATAGWAFLAGLSLFQGGWMATYVATGSAAAGGAVGVVAAVAVVAAFLRRGADRAAARAGEAARARRAAGAA